MSTLSCVIIDDEPAAIATLKDLIAEHALFIEVVDTANTVSSGVACLEKVKPDLVFLDVILGTTTSFDLLEQLEDYNFTIVFTTSHEAFALRAYDYNSIYYLLKPVSTKAFKKAVQKLKDNHHRINGKEQLKQAVELSNQSNLRLAINDRQGTEFVKQNKVAFLKGSTSYTEVNLIGGDTKIVSKRLGVVSEKLNPEVFLRVHKSYLVNLEEVAFLENGKMGSIVLKNGETVPLGKAYRTELIDRLESGSRKL